MYTARGTDIITPSQVRQYQGTTNIYIYIFMLRRKIRGYAAENITFLASYSTATIQRQFYSYNHWCLNEKADYRFIKYNALQ